MDISNWGVIRSVSPRIPHIIKTAILACLGRSPNVDVQDVVTEIFITITQPIAGTPISLVRSQNQFNREYAIVGHAWIAKYTIPVSKDLDSEVTGIHLRNALAKVVRFLGCGDETYQMPSIADVQGEWTGYRRDARLWSLRPELSEREQYEHLMREVKHDSPVILYFHGGAYCLMDPSDPVHRWFNSSLARDTGGRCFSVRYRLAPQNPFPAALLDALVAYLALLYPPPDAFHSAIPASRIILAGDSSGAGLATALLLLLLTIIKQDMTHISFNNASVSIPCPPVAGTALISPWLDISRSLPSVQRNARYDVLAAPLFDPSAPSASPAFPPDEAWPTNPPRVETYCDATMIIHPLVSPLAAPIDAWTMSPPIYLHGGWEGMQDENEVFCRRIHQSGSTVIFEGYTGMPHCFVFGKWNNQGRKAYDGLLDFCRQITSKNGIQKRTYGTWMNRHGLIRKVDLDRLGLCDVEMINSKPYGREIDLNDDLVDELMDRQKAWRVELENHLRAISNAPGSRLTGKARYGFPAKIDD